MAAPFSGSGLVYSADTDSYYWLTLLDRLLFISIFNRIDSNFFPTKLHFLFCLGGEGGGGAGFPPSDYIDNIYVSEVVLSK